MTRAIIVALGPGGLLLVKEGPGLRPPIAQLEPGDNADERVLATLEMEGFTAGLSELGNEDGNVFYLAQLEPLGEYEVDGWMPCGDNPAGALRRLATRCPAEGQRIYEAAARRVEAHLARYPLAA